MIVSTFRLSIVASWVTAVMHPTSCATVVAEAQGAPIVGSGPVHFAVMVVFTFDAASVSAAAVAASVTGPAAGRQLIDAASAPVVRLSSHLAIAFRFALTYRSTALPIPSVHGSNPARAAPGARVRTRTSATNGRGNMGA